ncbi:hypothetical protein CFC21_094603 [Triticum aestivum]|uniref:Myb-like domain-containing protein n=2 Tax=Triticum aestivum TaxID=4565 RepID=A0A3B6QKY9_WHEAT|nr:uncharacterized protein LOC123142169 [Triticum aestivum]KAF7092081.1 hypothetical protein CFC21_094603 [Triticum aestivum]
MSTKITVTYQRKRGTSRAQVADGATPEPPPVSSSGVAGSQQATKDQADADANVGARSSNVLARFDKSANITITHKRKRGTSLAQTTDRATSELATVSSGGLADSEAPQDGADTHNDMFNGSNHQQDACKPKQESAIEESAKLCAHASKKEQKEIPLCEPLPRMERPGICSLPVAEVWNDKLHCTNDAVNPIPASSSVWDVRHANGTTNQAKDSNNSSHAAINSHQGPEDTTSRRNQCKNRFSPQLTFQRRVKRKIKRNYTSDNCKEYSTLACNPQSLPINATPLLKVTNGDFLDTADKVAKEGTSTGLTVSAQRLLAEKSSRMLKSTVQHTVSTQHIEDARAEDWSKTLGRVVEAAEAVEMKELHDDPPESKGSTKHIPIIVLDGDNDERARGKLPENSKVVQEENKSRFNLGKINLNSVELPQERLHGLDDSSVQRLTDQDHFVTGQKQVSQPIERLFFTKEKDAVHGKEQHQEGTPALHTLYSNMYYPTPSRKSGSSKEPKSMPSELKFRIMDNAPESSLDCRLDSFQYSGKSSGIHLLTERINTYSYKRHQVPWSEEELDFLWIGVRRYGKSNWNAMLRDTRLRFSSSRMSEDLSEQWSKEQKKLLRVDLQSIRTSALGSEPTPHIAEGYAGSSSCTGSSMSPFLAAQSDLPLGEVHLQNAHALDRGQHYLSSLGRFNLHGINNNVPRNFPLGGFPGASSSRGRNGSKRRKSTKLEKSYYDNRSHWCQELPERTSSQLLPINQQPVNSLSQWPTKGADTGKSWLNPEMWSSASQALGQSTAEPLHDNLRAAHFLFPDDKKPHDMPDIFEAGAEVESGVAQSSKKLFWTSGDTLVQNQRAAAMAAGPSGANPSDTGASSEGTVSDS